MIVIFSLCNFFIADLPAMFLTQNMYEVDFPSYVRYGIIGMLFGRELGHAIDASTMEYWVWAQQGGTSNDNFAR